jgi:hypothetical protein
MSGTSQLECPAVEAYLSMCFWSCLCLQWDSACESRSLLSIFDCDQHDQLAHVSVGVAQCCGEQ